MKKETKCSILYVAIFFFVLHVFSFAKKEDIKDTWLAQELNEAIPLLEVMCLLNECLIFTVATHLLLHRCIYKEHLHAW